MKIAHFTDTFYPSLNGVVTSIVNLSKALSHEGHSVTIFAPQPPHDKHLNWDYPEIKLELLPSMPALFYPDFRLSSPLSLEILRLMNEDQPDIIHFHTPLTVGLAGILIGKMKKIPIVGTFHTYFMEPEYLQVVNLDILKFNNKNVATKIGWVYSNMLYNQADVVISPSIYTKHALQQNGIAKDVTIISNGIQDQSSVKRTSLNTMKLPESYFLYVGRVSREKSIDILIEAFNLYCEKESKAHLVLVGDGPALGEMKELASKTPYAKRILFLGSIDHDSLMDSGIHRNAIAFVTASKSENQAVSVLEAMSFGLPIIGVDSRGLPELIHKNGILCPSDDTSKLAAAMLQLNTDTKLREAYSEGSLKLVKQHSITSTTEQMIHVYKTLSEEHTQ